ncbi:uncharacterized protein LOC134749677 [Cydia strobilella]|uniref:uncharacterized protein LOC134749677 n=1 Tax=Cydia strobilella TaxID=1100964 RepID=UPI003006CC61
MDRGRRGTGDHTVIRIKGDSGGGMKCAGDGPGSTICRKGGGRRECGEAGRCACDWRAPPAPPAPPHPLRALDDTPPPLLRSNPLYTEEEEQEVVIIVDSLEEEDVVDGGNLAAPCAPRRVPSTSSGYGSNGRVSPSLPKTEAELPDSKHEGSQTSRASTSDTDSPGCTLSRSLKEDIRACLGGCRWDKDVGVVVEAAVKGAGGITAARARLHAALLALHEPLPRIPNRGPSLPYCGPGVRPGDVTMMPKTTEMSLLAASALFTLDSARGKALSRSLAKRERRRRRCRAALAILALLMLLAAVGAVELLLSRGQRVFGVVL